MPNITKRKLDEWAAIAEIVGTVAVVASLLVVAYTVSRNTTVLQAASDNLIYQLQDEVFADTSADPGLAMLITKYMRGESLTDEEEYRYGQHVSRLVNRWELAYQRHRQGLMSDQQWIGWNRFYSAEIRNVFPVEWWPDWRFAYEPGFAAQFIPC